METFDGARRVLQQCYKIAPDADVSSAEKRVHLDALQMTTGGADPDYPKSYAIKINAHLNKHLILLTSYRQ